MATTNKTPAPGQGVGGVPKRIPPSPSQMSGMLQGNMGFGALGSALPKGAVMVPNGVPAGKTATTRPTTPGAGFNTPGGSTLAPPSLPTNGYSGQTNQPTSALPPAGAPTSGYSGQTNQPTNALPAAGFPSSGYSGQTNQAPTASTPAFPAQPVGGTVDIHALLQRLLGGMPQPQNPYTQFLATLPYLK